MSPPLRTVTALALALLVATTACGATTDGSTTPPPTTNSGEPVPATGPASTGTASTGTTSTEPTGSPTTTVGLPTVPDGIAVPSPISALPLAVIAVDDEPLVVAIADSGATRRQGLMAVGDLLDLDGMLFVWETDSSGGFWMRDTVLPLDIAFFSFDGTLVNTFPMEPCDLGSDCPVYPAGGIYRFALETAQGRLTGLGPDSRLTIPVAIAEGT